jgi:5-aminopentanamidase
MSSIRLALSQFGAGLGDVSANLEQMRASLAAAAADDAELICFPELSLSGYLLEAAQYTSELLDAVEHAERELAADSRRLGVAVLYGAPLRAPGGRLYNAVIRHDPDGRRLVYAKTHMVAKERLVFSPGDDFVVDGRGIALACCYDLAFPEAIRVLTLRGARLLVVPMAWEVQRAFVMHRVVAARAVENVAYVVAINQCDTVGDLRFDGGSRVVDPLGETVVALGGAAEFAMVEIDLDRVARLRDGRDPGTYPLLEDRRPDLYGQIDAEEILPPGRGVLSQTSVSWARFSTQIEAVR